MSRSKIKTPIYGSCSGSEKADKKAWHTRFRQKEKQRLHIFSLQTEHISTHELEVSNVWSMNKDGKRYYSDKQAQMDAKKFPNHHPLWKIKRK